MLPNNLYWKNTFHCVQFLNVFFATSFFNIEIILFNLLVICSLLLYLLCFIPKEVTNSHNHSKARFVFAKVKLRPYQITTHHQSEQVLLHINSNGTRKCERQDQCWNDNEVRFVNVIRSVYISKKHKMLWQNYLPRTFHKVVLNDYSSWANLNSK